MRIFGYLLAPPANPVAFPQTVRCAVRSAGWERMGRVQTESGRVTPRPNSLAAEKPSNFAETRYIADAHSTILRMYYSMLFNLAEKVCVRPDGGQTHP